MNSTIAIGATFFLGAFYSWTSRINGTFFFGRTAGSNLSDSAEARVITRQYLASIVLATGLSMLLAWVGGLNGMRFSVAGPLTEIAAFLASFARANRQVRALGLERGELGPYRGVVQVPLLETARYSIPNTLITLVPALLGAIVVVVGLLTIGNTTDVQLVWSTWNAQIESRHLDGLFSMGLGLLSASTVLLLTFRRTVRLRTRLAQYSVRASIVMEWVGLTLILLVVGCNYLKGSLSQQGSRTFIMLGVVAALGTTVWNQARKKRFVPPSVELGADDRWRWGLFYVDRNDPAVFVQSRCGAGYTLNYGRVVAWPISLAFLTYFVSMVFLHYRS